MNGPYHDDQYRGTPNRTRPPPATQRHSTPPISIRPPKADRQFWFRRTASGWGRGLAVRRAVRNRRRHADVVKGATNNRGSPAVPCGRATAAPGRFLHEALADNWTRPPRTPCGRACELPYQIPQPRNGIGVLPALLAKCPCQVARESLTLGTVQKLLFEHTTRTNLTRGGPVLSARHLQPSHLSLNSGHRVQSRPQAVRSNGSTETS
jgi:hypothetical protein